MGGDGLAAAAPFGLSALADLPRFQPVAHHALGTDTLTVLARP